MKKFAIAALAAALFPLSAGSFALAQTRKVHAPVQFKQLPSTPINLHMNEDSKAVYQALGKTLGLTVVFDPDYASRVVQVDMTDATAAQALQIIGDLTRTYAIPVTPNTILVAPDTRQKHNDLDQQDDHIFYLKNISQQSDANEVVNALRTQLSDVDARVYLVSSENAIVVSSTPENIARAQSLIDELNKPRKTYRLTYTVTEMDGTRKVSTQQFAMILTDGQKSSLNQSSRVPVPSGTYQAGSGPAQIQYTYIDVGLKFDATLFGIANGARLNSDVTQSGFIDEKSPDGSQDHPVQRQLTLEGSAMLTNGKPLALGSMDIPGSTRHLEVEVVMEEVA